MATSDTAALRVDPTVAEDVVRIAVLVAAALVVEEVVRRRADGVGRAFEVAEQPGSADSSRASVPAVCGAAIDVPLNES